MASRQSLRLLGMGPELRAFHVKCFICLLNLDIVSVLRCHLMPCCGKFIHKRCFQKARETSFQCGHCRLMPDENSNITDSVTDELRANESLDQLEENPVWNTPPRLQGPSVIERARTAIADLRGSSAAHNLHHHSMRSWVHLPHPLTSWSGT